MSRVRNFALAVFNEWPEKKKGRKGGGRGSETRERATCDNEKVGGIFIITQSAESGFCVLGNESASSAFLKRHVLITVTSRWWPAVLMIIN